MNVLIRLGCLLVLLAASLPALAQSEATAPPADYAAKRADIAQRLSAAQQALDAIKQAPSSEPKQAERLTREIDLLKQFDALEAQLQSADETRAELETNRQNFEQQLAALRRDGPTETRPYSFLLLDTLRDTLSTEQSRASAASAASADAAAELDHAKQTLEQQEAERRRIKEAHEKNTEQNRAAELAAELNLAELAADLAAQEVALRHAELNLAKSAEQVHQVHVNLIEETLAWIQKDTVFSKDDLKNELVEIEKQEADLKQALHAAEVALQNLDAQWASTRQKQAAVRQPTPALVEEEQTANLARSCQTRKTNLVQKELEFLGLLRPAWEYRFKLANGAFERKDLDAWENETNRTLEKIDFERRLEELLVGSTRKELADLERRLQTAQEQDAELTQWIAKEQSLYQSLIETHSANLVTLDAHSKLHQRLLDEIHQHGELHSISDWLAASWHGAMTTWNLELANVDDDRSVTVGKVVSGVALLLCGIWVSRWLTGGVVRRVLLRLGVHDGTIVTFQSLSFYVLVVTSALMALHLVNVPLTVFTFMGGAVAIGVGFGSQNILNNFISGVILLVERPIRVGDLIEVGNLQGTVETIGTRSTRIRTGTNLEIIVPNSSFLESNVVNWTLGDSTIRCSVKVGLAYGSPTREAARLLKHAADEHKLGVSTPEPFVWFSEFAENALDFELHFWIDIRTLSDRNRIESDLRFMIDQYFNEAGITIAFPQRDVHLALSKPLEVSLLPQPVANPQEGTAGRKAA